MYISQHVIGPCAICQLCPGTKMSYDWALFLLLRYHKTYRLIRTMRENPATTEKYSILQDFLPDLQDLQDFAGCGSPAYVQLKVSRISGLILI